MSLPHPQRCGLHLVLATVLLMAALPASASAQVEVVEEDDAASQVVERGEVRQGRGTLLGLYLVSPLYPTELRRADDPDSGASFSSTLPVSHPGVGLGLRGGWEFPVGLALELFLEFAAHYVDNDAPASNAMVQAGVGGSARFLFFNPSAIVPFVQLSLAGRAIGFDWAIGPDVTSAEGATFDIGGGVGVQIEMSSELGVEFGVNVTALLPIAYFADTALVISPFAGVVAYLDEE
ncbi:MAG: hypothetical protein AB8I08_33640 [Sandaracinaceae bacterium]